MIAIAGATGRTGGRVAEDLLAKGAKVRAIGRNADKLARLKGLGAEASVGSVEDVSFLTEAFRDTDAVYLVLPEDLSQPDMRAYQDRVSGCYVAAITNAKVPFVVDLSSMGAQHPQGTGPIVGLHLQEQKLNRVEGLNVLHLRAAYFMENLFMNIAPLRQGIFPGGMRGDFPMPWIATKDIGTYAATRLAARDFSGHSVQELHGQRDLSMNEAASIVGKAIGKPDLAYVQMPVNALEASLLQIGLPRKTAELLIEMWNGANTGLIVPQQMRTPANTTPTSLETFLAEVFVPAFQRAL